MKPIKGTKALREQRLALVADLDARDWSQSEMAAELGVTQQQISRDLQKLIKRYQAEQAATRKRMVARKKERMRRQLKTLKEAWDKSWKDQEQQISETVIEVCAGGKDNKKERKKAILRRQVRLPQVEIQRLIFDIERDLSKLDALYPDEEAALRNARDADGKTVPVKVQIEYEDSDWYRATSAPETGNAPPIASVPGYEPV
jgi:hypothetical protein